MDLRAHLRRWAVSAAILLVAVTTVEAEGSRFETGAPTRHARLSAKTPLFDLEAENLTLYPLLLDGKPEGRYGFGKVTLRLRPPEGFDLSDYPRVVRSWFERSFDAVVIRTSGGSWPGWLELSKPVEGPVPTPDSALALEDLVVRTRSEIAWDPGESMGRPLPMPAGREAVFLLAADGTTWMYDREARRATLVDCGTGGRLRVTRATRAADLDRPESGRAKLEFEPGRHLARADLELRFANGSRPIRLRVVERFEVRSLVVNGKPGTHRDITPASWPRRGSIMRLVEVSRPGPGPLEIAMRLEGAFPPGDPDGAGGYNEFYVDSQETCFPLTWLGVETGGVRMTLVVPKGWSACVLARARELRVFRGGAERSSEHDLGELAPGTDLKMIPGPMVRAGRVDLMPGRIDVERLRAYAAIVEKAVVFLEEYLDEPLARRPVLAASRWGAFHQLGGMIGINPEAIGSRPDSEWMPTVVHEAAHLWFGNLVRFDHDFDFLSEGLASFFEYRALAGSTLGAQARANRNTMLEQALLSPGLPLLAPAQRFGTSSHQVAYHRGFALFDALERILGEDGFRDALRTYLKARKRRDADAKAFADILPTRVARAAFGYWALTGLVPEVHAKLGKGHIAFDERFLPPYPLEVRVEVRFESGRREERRLRIAPGSAVHSFEWKEKPESVRVLGKEGLSYLIEETTYRRTAPAFGKAWRLLRERHDPRGALEYFRRYRPRTAGAYHDFLVGKCHALLGESEPARTRLRAALDAKKLPADVAREAKALLESL